MAPPEFSCFRAQMRTLSRRPTGSLGSTSRAAPIPILTLIRFGPRRRVLIFVNNSLIDFRASELQSAEPSERACEMRSICFRGPVVGARAEPTRASIAGRRRRSGLELSSGGARVESTVDSRVK